MRSSATRMLTSYFRLELLSPRPWQNVDKEFKRLRDLGVRFTQEPAEMGPVTTAVFDDTSGNLIQMAHRQ